MNNVKQLSTRSDSQAATWRRKHTSENSTNLRVSLVSEMDAEKEVEQESEGVQSNSGGSTDEQHEDKPHQAKLRSVPEFLGLSRCAACYNHKKTSMFRRGGDGESSSSAEDSGPEVDCESEAESSSSSCSEPPSETPEMTSLVCGDAAEPRGEDGDGREEAGETLEDKMEKKEATKKTTPVKPSVVSTLHLQVLPRKHDDDFCIVKQHLSEREGSGNRGGPISSPQPPQMRLPWQQPTPQQHHLTHRCHQPQPPLFPPLSAQGQRLPPPLHPVFHPPQAANAPQPCWCCYGGLVPPPAFWSHHSNGHR